MATESKPNKMVVTWIVYDVKNLYITGKDEVKVLQLVLMILSKRHYQHC
jgi:hypothetical protein